MADAETGVVDVVGTASEENMLMEKTEYRSNLNNTLPVFNIFVKNSETVPKEKEVYVTGIYDYISIKSIVTSTYLI